jgi:hypothetical protein
MTLPSEALYSPKTAELRSIKYSDVYYMYEARLLYAIKSTVSFRKTL